MELLNGALEISCLQTRRYGISASGSDRPLTRFPWTRLPAEIRLTVLDDFAARWPSRNNKGWTYAHLATVCKEWQVFFEKKTFHLVRLDLLSLENFKVISEHRQHLIHHIQFCFRPDIAPLLSNVPWKIKLETYHDNPQRSVQKLAMLKEQTRELLAILKKWPATKELVLELTADHMALTIAGWFERRQRNVSFRRDVDFVFSPKNKDGSQFSLEPQPGRAVFQMHRNMWQRDSWIKGLPTYPPPSLPDEVLDCLKNGWLQDDISYELFPWVDAVTCLVLFEPFFLCHGTLLLKHLLGKLPRVKHVISQGPRPEIWWRWLFGQPASWYIGKRCRSG